MPRPASIALALVLLAVLAVCGFALYIASTIARPHGNSLTEERRWEQDHGLWGDFESLERTACVAPGKDGYELHCELVSAPEPSDRYVIVSHGFRANRYGAAKCVGAWESLGYNCIVYDLRAHGENAPATCTLGKVESEDLLTLVADARERFGEDITLGLMGESMGSATTLCALGSRPKVDFAVADCPFANLRELLRSGYDQARVGPLLPVVDAACRLRYGFELAETSPRLGARGQPRPPLPHPRGGRRPHPTLQQRTLARRDRGLRRAAPGPGSGPCRVARGAGPGGIRPDPLRIPLPRRRLGLPPTTSNAPHLHPTTSNARPLSPTTSNASNAVAFAQLPEGGETYRTYSRRIETRRT